MNPLISAGLLSAAMILFACNPQDTETPPTETCTPAEGKVVELTSDVTGKTYTVGETVKLTWKVDRTRISNGQVVVDISPDNGMSWSAIPTAGIAIPSGDQYQCMSLDWKIGSENEVVEYETTNSQCILRIHQYSEISNGIVFTAQKFTVKK